MLQVPGAGLLHLKHMNSGAPALLALWCRSWAPKTPSDPAPMALLDTALGPLLGTTPVALWNAGPTL